MNLAKEIEALVSKTSGQVQDISHGRWSSSRLWSTVVFAVIVLFASYFALQPAQIEVIGRVVIWFLITATASKIAFGFFNAWVQVTARKCACKDGKISAEEKKEIDSARVTEG
jgi:hypothetical protein